MADIKKVRGSKVKGVQESKKKISSIDDKEKKEVVPKKNIKREKVVSSESLPSVKKVKSRKIHFDLSDEQEKELDKEIEFVDDLSITVMIIILVLCFFVGISVGYMIYRIAINSSNAMMIVKYFLNM